MCVYNVCVYIMYMYIMYIYVCVCVICTWYMYINVLNEDANQGIMFTDVNLCFLFMFFYVLCFVLPFFFLEFAPTHKH